MFGRGGKMKQVKMIDDGSRLLEIAHTSYASIAIGCAKGKVWVDDETTPSLIMVYSEPVGGYNITGSADDAQYEDLIHFFDHELIPKLKAASKKIIEFSVDDEALEKRILAHFSNRKIKSEVEYFYELGDCRSTHELTTVQLSKELLEEVACYENSDLLMDSIDEAWSTKQDFFENSIGFITLDGKKVTGVAVGSARFKDKINISIEVDKAYRQKGLAAALTADFIQTCQENSLKPVWQCVESNIGSQKTAEKNHFVLIKKHLFYWFDI